MTDCNTTPSFAAAIIVLALLGVSYFQALRLEMSLRGMPKVEQVQYALDVATMAPYLDDKLRLVVSLHPKGGAPWLTFPPGVHRIHVERLYDVVIRDGKAPTEENILQAGRFARTELQALKGWALQKGLAHETRAGRHAGWLFNKAGERRLIHAYMRLQGKYVTGYTHSPIVKPRQIPR